MTSLLLCAKVTLAAGVQAAGAAMGMPALSATTTRKQQRAHAVHA
jgi:hypothetical protein